jgi:ribosomal peptide maturation radical SAM protein 1
MISNFKNILLISMPFAEVAIPSIQLALLEKYTKERDIGVVSKHLYLKAAEIYGLKNYNFLLNNPSSPYFAQIFFLKYVFPDYWKHSEDQIKKYFNNKINKNNEFNYDILSQKTEEFFIWVFSNINWNNFDIVGFTLNYGQFLPSLAIAKKIKEIYPDKKIVLGGSRTAGEIGKKVLEAFDFIDYIISGDGEESLFQLAIGEEVEYENPNSCIDLNELPFPDFDSFYQDLNTSSNEIQQYYQVYGRLPIEISRGCWWNKCTFCNLNLQYNNYREKSVEKILEEIKFLSNKYKMLTFQMTGNTLPLKNYRYLFEEIKKIDKDFIFIAEARAGRLKSDDYKLLKEAGFTTIQTGIESFSSNYLKKMNKGTLVIDNIAALKFCKENGITNRYNIIIDFPNEDCVDFEETKKNIQLFCQYLDPPNIAPLEIGVKSHIFQNPEQYGIDHLDFVNTDQVMFPKDILEKRISFFYTYNKKELKHNNQWHQLIDDWRKIREKFIIEANKRQTTVDQLVFYYVDGGDFLKIYDKRNSGNVLVYMLDELEREIFLSCIDVISFQKLCEKFSNIPDDQLTNILLTFEKTGIVFREDDFYLSLPLSYNRVINKKPAIKEITQFA